MRAKRISAVVLALALLLAVCGGSLAQGPEGGMGPAAQDAGLQPPATDASPLAVEVDLGPGFYYQGVLTENGTPVSGNRQMEFKLWDAASSGARVGGTLTPTVAVSKGQFSVALNYDVYPIDGRALWLGVRAKDAGGAWRDLGRRQILAVPYAMSLKPGANIYAREGYDGMYVYGLWDAIHAETAATDDNHAAIYALALSSTGQATAGNFATNSSDGVAVIGRNHGGSGPGVAGFNDGNEPADQTGYWKPAGQFGGANGVVSWTKKSGGYGVLGWSKVTDGSFAVGVYGNNDSAGGWAGYFASSGNGVYVSTPGGKSGLSVSGGTKSGVVATDSGSRLLYSEEATEVWFADYGFGKLAGGIAAIAIDPLFAQTVNLVEPYHVFLQAYGDAELYVTNRTATGFEVRLREGDPAVEFSYRVVAKRAGYERDRLERAPWADEDANLYPDKAGAADALQQDAPADTAAP